MRTCEQCRTNYTPVRVNQTYCSRACYRGARNDRRRGAAKLQRYTGETTNTRGEVLPVRYAITDIGGVLAWCPVCTDMVGVEGPSLWDRWCPRCDHSFTFVPEWATAG